LANRWATDYPRAVACLQHDLDQVLTCRHYKSPAERTAIPTTNPSSTTPRGATAHPAMDVVSERTSMDRILFAVFNQEDQNLFVSPLYCWHKPFDVTAIRCPLRGTARAERRTAAPRLSARRAVRRLGIRHHAVEVSSGCGPEILRPLGRSDHAGLGRWLVPRVKVSFRTRAGKLAASMCSPDYLR
jgi:hypothetical protein